MTLHLSPQLEDRVRGEAARRGIPPEELVERIVEERLSDRVEFGRRDATLALLSQWSLEDRTDDPVELERRQKEWDAFRTSMNEDSLSDRPVYP